MSLDIVSNPPPILMLNAPCRRRKIPLTPDLCYTMPVFAHSSCYNEVPQTDLFTDLEAGNSRSRCRHVRWGLSSGLQTSCLLIWQKELEISLEFLLLGHESYLWGLHPHGISTSQKPHLAIPPPLGVKIFTYEFGGDINIETTAMPKKLIYLPEALPFIHKYFYSKQLKVLTLQSGYRSSWLWHLTLWNYICNLKNIIRNIFL